MSRTIKQTDRIVEELREGRLPIVEQCKRTDDEGNVIACKRIINFKNRERCAAYAYPETKWRLGNCFLASHVQTEAEVKKGKVRVGQQKQKKNRR